MLKQTGLLLLVTLLSGCATMISDRIAGNLGTAILNQDDPETVRAGAPAYLLLLDSFIEGDPDAESLLLAGAKLNAAYAAAFAEDPARARRMADKAHNYATQALCEQARQTCNMESLAFDDFLSIIATLDEENVDALFSSAMTWALRIHQRSDDWAVVANLPKVKAMLQRVNAIDETYDRGQAHLYLGIMDSLVPATMGGKPEQGRLHFERAIELSNGRNLSAKLEFARHYARLIYNRNLHDRLLKEVLESDPVAPGLTLSNVLAQKDARALLAESDDYFFE